MAVQRDNPYGRFNFVVALGDGGEDEVAGGFEEVSRITAEIGVAEYRNGNDHRNHPRKVSGLTRVGDVRLKRGVIGDLRLFRWFAEVGDGTPSTRDVTITLLDEARAPVLTFKLRAARPARYSAGPLDARGGEVAIEELTLAYERLEVE